MRYRNRINTNNVNICVHVTNNNAPGTGGSSSDLTQIKSDITSLQSSMNNLLIGESGSEWFESKLNTFLSSTERSRIKSLVGDQEYEILQNYIEKYDTFGKIQYKETEIYFDENNTDPTYRIKAEIDGIWHDLNDAENTDNDTDTVYKLPVSGFVIGIEIYKSIETNAERETFTGIKTSYNNETDITTIYMNKGDYNFIHSLTPNNKIHVYSLIVK